MSKIAGDEAHALLSADPRELVDKVYAKIPHC